MATVLVAEDDPGVRAYLLAALSGAGHTVLECADGVAALAAARAARPSVVVADLRMPGLDGLNLARLIKADPDLSATRVVLLSGERAGEAAALAAGADDFLVKPVRLAALLAAVVPPPPP
jgi:CheY-like chemotaxis protein